MSNASRRLTQVKDFLTNNKTATTIPFDPDSTRFPTRKELPAIDGAPAEAAWVWGKDDNLGRLNLLTPTRVAAAAKEIRTGDIVPVNLPLTVPTQPAFNRESFQHKIKDIGRGAAFDDIWTLNTQSGTQWDGFRHFSHLPSGSFYNGAKSDDIMGPNSNLKIGVHHWAEHGIAGRGVLIDFSSYAEKKGIQFDRFDSYPISYEDLHLAGQAQGIDIRPIAQGGDIRPGDLVFVRSGWTEQYNRMPPAERHEKATRFHTIGAEDKQRYAGLSQEQKMLDWLHDSYIAVIAGDSPTCEAWPTHESYHLHEYLLALWGIPIGEMLDLERLSQRCKELNRWTFFFTSSPSHCPGGVGSHVNGMALF